MKNFIKGMLFVTLAIPLLDGVVSLAGQGVEYLCTKIAVGTYKLKEQLEEESESTRVIGFQATIAEEEKEDYEEE